MFLVAIKTAVVESLRSVWFEGQDVGQEAHTLNPDLDAPNADPIPRRITLEYPEESQDWPTILVQVRPTIVEWTGITPDEVVDASLDSGFPAIDRSTTEDPALNENPSYKLIRQGRFEASCMLQILSLTSMERDRMWDNLIKLLMMGRKKNATNNFFTTMESHDLVGLTIMEGSVRAIGDTIGQGTPWDAELLTYEAAVEFDMVGTFFADEYTEDLVPLRAAEAYEYIAWEGNTGIGPDANENPPLEGDGQGSWTDGYE